MKEFDVLIIGGGPSGAMTGIELQKRGFNTCIIDKASFPREKLCGGGLTQKTMDLLATYCPEIDPKEYTIGQTQLMDFYHKTTRVTHTKIAAPCFFTDRKLLDTSLIGLYKAKGGTLIENYRITSKNIHFKENKVTTDSEVFQYRYLVGACGCSTLFTKPFNIKRNDFFCLETHIPKEQPNDEPCRIYFGAIKIGYGWYFPKNDHDVLGIGGENSEKQIPAQAEAFFCEATSKPRLPSKGAFIPSGKKINALTVQSNVILVGDTAGFIDPITGEGIYYALLSGIYAAESIEQSAKSKANQLPAIYSSKCSTIKQNMKWGFLFVRILYSDKVMSYFIKALQTHPRFVKYYLDEVMSSYRQNYKNFIWHYFTKVRNKRAQ